MNNSQLSTNTILISTIEFEHLMFESQRDQHIVTLVDMEGHNIIRGYGKSVVEAINDLHSLLI